MPFGVNPAAGAIKNESVTSFVFLSAMDVRTLIYGNIFFNLMKVVSKSKILVFSLDKCRFFLYSFFG